MKWSQVVARALEQIVCRRSEVARVVVALEEELETLRGRIAELERKLEGFE